MRHQSYGWWAEQIGSEISRRELTHMRSDVMTEEQFEVDESNETWTAHTVIKYYIWGPKVPVLLLIYGGIKSNNREICNFSHIWKWNNTCGTPSITFPILLKHIKHMWNEMQKQCCQFAIFTTCCAIPHHLNYDRNNCVQDISSIHDRKPNSYAQTHIFVHKCTLLLIH